MPRATTRPSASRQRLPHRLLAGPAFTVCFPSDPSAVAMPPLRPEEDLPVPKKIPSPETVPEIRRREAVVRDLEARPAVQDEVQNEWAAELDALVKASLESLGPQLRSLR